MKLKNSLILSFAALSIIGCKKDYTANANDTTASQHKLVRAFTIAPLEDPLPIVATGKVLSKKEILLSFKTGGIVKRLLAEEANQVKKGQVLAQLDLSEINSKVISAKNAYEKSERDLERATNLYRDTVGTLEQKQNAMTTKDIAQANLNIANFNLQYSKIKAPVNGTVFNRLVEVGELVSPGQPIYRVGSSGSKGSQILRLGLSDKDIVLLKTGDNATVGFDAFPKTEFPAMVSEIGQSANPSTGLFEVELTLDGYFPEIKNGFIGNVQIFPSKATQQFKIPMNALVEGVNKEASIFYTTDDRTVKNANISIDAFSDDFFTISTSAIPKNAKVITEGAPFLRTNDTIKIVR